MHKIVNSLVNFWAFGVDRDEGDEVVDEGLCKREEKFHILPVDTIDDAREYLHYQ